MCLIGGKLAYSQARSNSVNWSQIFAFRSDQYLSMMFPVLPKLVRSIAPKCEDGMPVGIGGVPSDGSVSQMSPFLFMYTYWPDMYFAWNTCQATRCRVEKSVICCSNSCSPLRCNSHCSGL